ncbi:MAG: glycoside hydrolase family 31 protein [Oscillospiraceae bacterium]|nr:glycoside hydrolase family 31 protein [Oscillospiraceae bacterium]
MYFFNKNGALIARRRNETISIEAWGVNALRVRATHNADFSASLGALEENVSGESGAEVVIDGDKAVISNGKISAELHESGRMEFFKNGRSILKEYYRDWCGANGHSPSMKVSAREFKPVSGNDYSITARFEAQSGEKIFGMGQYQQPNLDLKGCILETAQRNSQISIPFYISNKGYGFLWNNAGIGEVMFGANYTQWTVKLSEELDYWITADDTPKAVVENYTAVTGRAPEFPENALGLWQCKLRYRTQDEVLEVAREYKRRGIPLDVIVIDFFHWIRQGDWSFDPGYWQDPQAMVDELKEMGVRCMVSIWPTVDRKSVNFWEMLERGLFVRTERGSVQCFDFQGDTVIYDALNPEAREFIWDKVKENYYNYGIDMFWLDEAEPEYSAYDFEHYRHYTGPALKVGNSYPKAHAKAFYDGMKKEGRTDIVNLLRCAWAGSQKYAALVWSGDIKSTFTALRDQLSAGLNIGIAGIPWWVSDTGGFFGDVTDEHFNELLIRWFQFSTFCPVLRMHGDRGPHDIPRLSDLDYGGGFSDTGRPNELWSYGEEVYRILKKYLDIRLGMKSYIKSVMDEASKNGSPVMRTMFYEFPDDEKCWSIDDQYMFGPKYLVAPVLYRGMTEREVYLPEGEWRNIHDNTVYTGGGTITAAAPVEIIPVYEKLK